MTPPPDSHNRHRFLAEVISQAVQLYHVFTLQATVDAEFLSKQAAAADAASRRSGFPEVHPIPFPSPPAGVVRPQRS
jgi:hypothetical protein